MAWSEIKEPKKTKIAIKVFEDINLIKQKRIERKEFEQKAEAERE